MRVLRAYARTRIEPRMPTLEELNMETVDIISRKHYVLGSRFNVCGDKSA